MAHYKGQDKHMNLLMVCTMLLGIYHSIAFYLQDNMDFQKNLMDLILFDIAAHLYLLTLR
ncbi:hypothetical protein H735_10905 [Vibrio owensii CAIM 1854 = LMG 25443]|uniref:Uncharacterized protein n=1 Tax=Vibrio owensii CAIM 1854 = LMG 25443 TaxID=1229493 RepID=A0A0C1VU71_9VIBR|nr:hypothetical protein H735_10905 [Vibrio owensii CAIM 1854 = LMG 25443]